MSKFNPFLHRNAPRWSALLLALALLWALTTLISAPAAHAATITVCPSGGDHPTIQAAVNNASPGDVIAICAGVYNESVDLSLMGSAISGPMGNLTLQASGPVTIAPAAGPAIWISARFDGDVTLIDLATTSPDASAIDLFADTHDAIEVNGAITVANVVAFQPAVSGILLQAQRSIFVTGTQAINAGASGVELATDAAITVTNSAAIGNGDAGFWISDRTFEERCSLTPVLLQGVFVQQNAFNGVQIGRFDGSLAVRMVDSQLLFNGGNGMNYVEPPFCPPVGRVDIENSAAIGNLGEEGGFFIGEPPFARLHRVTARQNANAGVAILPTFSGGHQYTITGSLIQSNTVGVLYDARTLEDPYSFPNTPTIFAQNAVCENQEAGMVMLADSSLYTETIAAKGSWWGAFNGPTHPANPAGTGDNVRDAATYAPDPPNDLEGGFIDFAPWIDQIHVNVSPGPIQPGLPVTILFRPQDSSATWQLAGGPGSNLDAPPFTLSASNGQLQVGASQGAVVQSFLNDDGEIEAIFTPEQPGAATVTLQGPCNLSIILPFEVQQTLAIDKAPAFQFVRLGEAATFTVTVANSGAITLTNAAVTDDLAPACSAALPNLAPGASYAYTCSDAPALSYTNVATVTAETQPTIVSQQGDDAAMQAQALLAASSAAQVQVFNPSLSVVKSVGLDPDACAAPGGLVTAPGAQLYYCLTLVNTGDVTFTAHTIDDPALGVNGFVLNAPLAPGASLAITRSLLPALGPVVLEEALVNTAVATSTALLGGGVLPQVEARASAAGQVEATTAPTALPPEEEPVLGVSRIYLPTVAR
ncbi:MAG: hypothetical protein WHS90_10800 [Caldilinea sp.]|uniref:DUF7507 domain-containing protein n=1 Tax=Caldilinea sp. TaxID=2293560 RepID=UPI0030B577F3